MMSLFENTKNHWIEVENSGFTWDFIMPRGSNLPLIMQHDSTQSMVFLGCGWVNKI